MTSSNEASFGDLFSGAVDRKIQELKAGLLEECEKLADERESKLRQENDKLRKECAEMHRLVQSPTVPSPPPQVEASQGVEAATDDLANPAAESDKVIKHSLTARPEFVDVHKMGSLTLHDDFWNEDRARPDHDHGYCHSNSLATMKTKVKAPNTKKSLVIDPSGHLKLTWDLMGIPILAWDLITIPMQVFGISDLAAMKVMGWVTLIFWTGDIPLCFITGFFDGNGDLVMNEKKIVKHYLKGMFFIDALIILADWLIVIFEYAASADPPPFLQNVAILRALRITRFVRLMRLRRLKEKLHSLQDRIDSETVLVIVDLINKIWSVLAVTHYVGCAFFFIGKSSVPGYESWLDTPYPQYHQGGVERETFHEAPWEYQYWTCLHWALTQFTPGGMHVQPQNIAERAYAIFCLLFGMVVFSSFIASVTQARMQLTKSVGKFERDLWLLRRYCRQNKISQQLTIRMRRYVDMVLIPKFSRMTEKDVVLLPQLTAHLRGELQVELHTKKVCVHPFFEKLRKNKAVMNNMCNSAIQTLPIAFGDVVFVSGRLSTHMYIMIDGACDYIPHDRRHPETRVGKNSWISEAVLWTEWVTQGQMQGFVESTATGVDSAKFRTVLRNNPLQMNVARAYATAFLDVLNQLWVRQGFVPSDFLWNDIEGNDIDESDTTFMIEEVEAAIEPGKNQDGVAVPSTTV